MKNPFVRHLAIGVWLGLGSVLLTSGGSLINIITHWNLPWVRVSATILLPRMAWLFLKVNVGYVFWMAIGWIVLRLFAKKPAAAQP